MGSGSKSRTGATELDDRARAAEMAASKPLNPKGGAITRSLKKRTDPFTPKGIITTGAKGIITTSTTVVIKPKAKKTSDGIGKRKGGTIHKFISRAHHRAAKEADSTGA